MATGIASDALENDIQKFLFTAVDPAYGASLYVSLHTASPGEAGTQATSETTVTGYARVAVARSAAGWAVSGAGVTNAAAINFAAATSGNNSITHIGIGTAASGAGKLLHSLPLDTAVPYSTGIAPKIEAGAIAITVD